ncbi:MAG: hypothetical protein GY705_12730, partial [Bacteroidetes bacterium]|nr:hypothetical protein [Bacteroidota bacterium]
LPNQEPPQKTDATWNEVLDTLIHTCFSYLSYYHPESFTTAEEDSICTCALDKIQEIGNPNDFKYNLHEAQKSFLEVIYWCGVLIIDKDTLDLDSLLRNIPEYETEEVTWDSIREDFVMKCFKYYHVTRNWPVDSFEAITHICTCVTHTMEETVDANDFVTATERQVDYLIEVIEECEHLTLHPDSLDRRPIPLNM